MRPAQPPPPPSFPRENGWLPDFVFTGDKFERGLAFFADPLGRISRFSREPADLAIARRLEGQAALPGLVNGHSRCLHRILRGRNSAHRRREGGTHAPAMEAPRLLAAPDIYDAARMAFLEMLLTGITCVGEFHATCLQPDGSPWPDRNAPAREILRAARDTGLRIALLKVACTRPPPGGGEIPPACVAAPEAFAREVDDLRDFAASNLPGDDVWVGVAAENLRCVTLDHLKAIASHAHARRYRIHLPLSRQPADNEACLAEHGRTPVALLVEHGLIDKRLTAVHALHISDDDARLLGAARALVCACPTTERARGDGIVPADTLLAAGVSLSLGSGDGVQIDLFEDARLLEYQLRSTRLREHVLATDVAGLLLQTATAAGARSLGASSGALEVGRPADFFTVGLFDPSIVGAQPTTLLPNIIFSLERRAVRDVWVGGHPRVLNGRHPDHGTIIHRFVDLQQRLWG